MVTGYLHDKHNEIELFTQQCKQAIEMYIEVRMVQLRSQKQLLAALSPHAALERGYAVIRDTQTMAVIRSFKSVSVGQQLDIQLQDAHIRAKVTNGKTRQGKV